MAYDYITLHYMNFFLTWPKEKPQGPQKQESLANAKVSARQRCVYEGP